jgi:hypothetical protein
MASDTKARVEAILSDSRLDTAARIERLRQMQTDALARQRASTEGMEPHRPDDGEELKTIERALLALGEEPVHQGPASL